MSGWKSSLERFRKDGEGKIGENELILSGREQRAGRENKAGRDSAMQKTIIKWKPNQLFSTDAGQQ